MNVVGLEEVRRGRKALTTTPSRAPDHPSELVERDFTALGSNQRWVADITYVHMPTGSCYISFITDDCTRRIVGWAVAASLHIEALPLQALEHALLSTSAEASNSGLVHHSDRGSQYVSLVYSDALISAGIKASVRTVGDSYDCQSVSTRSREDWGVPADAL